MPKFRKTHDPIPRKRGTEIHTDRPLFCWTLLATAGGPK